MGGSFVIHTFFVTKSLRFISDFGKTTFKYGSTYVELRRK